jgi:hypothetical protein
VLAGLPVGQMEIVSIVGASVKSSAQSMRGAIMDGRVECNSRLFASETSWQRYQSLVPPLRRTEQASERWRRRRVTMMLDLDQTSLFGNDGNDLPLSLQWMEKSPDVVRELYKRMISPSLRQAYQSYTSRGDEVDVIIYTRRPQLIHYKSCATGEVLDLHYNDDWHDAGSQLHIPASIREAEDVLDRYNGPALDEEESHDVLKAMERLLAARDAIAHELGLATPPHVVVTARQKDVRLTARHLRLDSSSAVLYDDNRALAGDENVVLVSPLLGLPRAQREELLDFMHQHLPPAELDEELVSYLEGAHPAEKSLRFDDKTGRYTWCIPELPSCSEDDFKWPILPPQQLSRARGRGAGRAGDEDPVLWSKTKHLLVLPGSSSSCGKLPLLHHQGPGNACDGLLSPVSEPASPEAADCRDRDRVSPVRACASRSASASDLLSPATPRLAC